MDLRQLSYFLKTARAGSITRAAAELNVAQPTLTKSIQTLEHQLGVTLFERMPRGVRLTPFGERLLHHAQMVEVQVNSAITDVAALREGRAGEVRVGAGPAWLRRHWPETLAAVMAELPQLRVTVRGGFDEGLLRDLASGDLDFVIAEIPLAEGNPTFTVEPLTEDDLVVICRQDHPLTAGGRVPPEALLDQWWVLPPEATLARRKLDALLLSNGLPGLSRITESDSLAFMTAVVATSDALTYVTRSVLLTSLGDNLRTVDVPELEAPRRAGLIFRSPPLVSPAAEYLIEKLRAVSARDPRN